MAVFIEPTKWAQTLGQDADVATIPNTASDTTPSIDKIFPSVFSIPLAQGGKAIPRSVLNGLFKLVGDWVYYIQNGGIASYSNTLDYPIGAFVKYNNEFYRCILANGVSTTTKPPTNTAYWSRITTTADSPTGEIKIWTSSTIPNGFLLCNGSAVSRTTYANLFAVIGTRYGAGDNSTTFNLPDLRDRYIIGANTNGLGTKIAEQLPNVTGEVASVRGSQNATGSGALSVTSAGTYSLEGATGVSSFWKIGVNASQSSSVYTTNGSVYPLSLALNFIIKT